MTWRHVGLALLVATIWGFAFVATKLALQTFSPPQLTALRFVIAAVPAAFLARPPVSWAMLIATGLTLFTGQFLFQFFGIARGMPPGLASIVVQTQALFTILFAALTLRERPTGRHVGGVAVAFAGLIVIATTVGHDSTAIGFGLTVMSAVSWGIGNVLVKRLPRLDMLNLVVWLSLVPPLPSLGLSLSLDGVRSLVPPRSASSAISIGAALYLGVIATVLAYAIWGYLLQRYSAGTVAPFALLVPFVAAYSSSLVFGERFGGVRLVGMALVLVGLAITTLPPTAVAGPHRGRHTDSPESDPRRVPRRAVPPP